MGKIKLFENAKNQVADTLKLPKDLSKGEVLISITGRDEVFIENYKGILECTSESVIIATGRCRVQFMGERLQMEYYTNEEMKIEGSLQKILFL